MKTSTEVNAGIEKINQLLSEISSIGWDICQYFEEKYKIDHYDWDAKIPDKNAAWIAQQANNCGMIETWNEFGFGQHVLDDDGVLQNEEKWLTEFLQKQDGKDFDINVWANVTDKYGEETVSRKIDYIYIDQYDEITVSDCNYNEYDWSQLDPGSQMEIINEIKREYGKG